MTTSGVEHSVLSDHRLPTRRFGLTDPSSVTRVSYGRTKVHPVDRGWIVHLLSLSRMTYADNTPNLFRLVISENPVADRVSFR